MKYSKIRKVKSPTRGTERSAGIDFFVPDEWNEGNPYSIYPGKSVLIPSGIKSKIPEGYALIAFNKSGVATKKGIIVGAEVVDEDYQGEIHLHLINTNQPYENFGEGFYSRESGIVEIIPGEKLIQFVLLPINYQKPEEVELDQLYEETTERGDGGFGSTGIK